MQRDADRADGLLQSIEGRLKADFGCDLEQAEALLASMEREEVELAEKGEAMLAKLKADFPQLME